MIAYILKGLLKEFFYFFGWNTHNKRCSFVGALQQIKRLGFIPATVIDVGAAVGKFTLSCSHVFPDSRYLLIEPLEENKDYLEEMIKTIPKAEYVWAVATAQPGEAILNVHSDLVGSSLYFEKEANIDGVPRNVSAVTLDELCENRGLTGPYLIKIDVQGAELDVLSGAKKILHQAEYIILEVSLFQFVKNGPQLYDVVTFMKSRSFVVYDMFGYHYKPLDGAMAQIDIAFVKGNGRFRKHHIYCANREQRERLTKRILKFRKCKKLLRMQRHG